MIRRLLGIFKPDWDVQFAIDELNKQIKEQIQINTHQIQVNDNLKETCQNLIERVKDLEEV